MEKTVNNFSNSLGNYLKRNLRDWYKLTKRVEIAEFLKSIPVEDLSVNARAYRDLVLASMSNSRITDKRAMLHLWDIYLKGSNLGVLK